MPVALDELVVIVDDWSSAVEGESFPGLGGGGGGGKAEVEAVLAAGGSAARAFF